MLLAGAFGVSTGALVVVGLLGHIPIKYMLPVSALYIVPFLVVLFMLMRPAVGLLTLLWPALYAAHAILIVAGAPIVFTGKWTGLNMLIPVAGYGLLSALVMRIRGRFALSRLKRLAGTQPAGGIEPEEATR